MRTRMPRILCLIAFLLALVGLLVSCTRTVYVTVPQQTTNNPTVTTSQSIIVTSLTQQATTIPLVNNSGNTWTAPDQILKGDHWAILPDGGAYFRSGFTLTLSWSADSSLDAFILTAAQCTYFRSMGIAHSWVARKSGTSGTLSVKVENDDTYYGIVKNNTGASGGPAHLYQATLTAK